MVLSTLSFVNQNALYNCITVYVYKNTTVAHILLANIYVNTTFGVTCVKKMATKTNMQTIITSGDILRKHIYSVKKGNVCAKNIRPFFVL